MDVWMKCVYGWMDGCMDKMGVWMDGWMDVWIKWVYGWMDKH